MNNLQPIDTDTLITITESEINQQVATAKRYPRRLGEVITEIETYATATDDVAAECIYAVPRDGKTIIGASVRFAEIVGSSWGNARYASRILAESDEWITAQGLFHDLEKNTAVSIEVRRRITKANGDRFGIDMIGVTGMAAMSIAMRNAILRGVPRGAWGGAYAKTHAMIVGTFETVGKRLEAAAAKYLEIGISSDQMMLLIDKKHPRDVVPTDMLTLRGTLQGIRDGDVTVAALLRDLVQRGGTSTSAKGAKADIGGKLEEGKNNAATVKKASKESKTEPDDKAGAHASAADSNSGDGAGNGATGDGGGQGEDGGGNIGGDDRDAGNGAGAESGDAGDDGIREDAGTNRAADAGNDEGNAAGKEAPTLAQGMPEPLGAFLDSDWQAGERIKLTNLANALFAAVATNTVQAVQEQFAPVFETAREPLAEAYRLMIAEAARLVRAARGKSKL